MATSAVCVTGLAVFDPASHLTGWGQGFLLLLIQLGGLGIITFTTVIISSLGGRLSLRQHDIVHQTAGVAPHVDHLRLARHVILYTLVLEAIGAVLLFLLWTPTLGAGGAWWPAVFHAISAFCNAGFSTFSDSLMGFANRADVLLVIMALIVAGGLGFLVLEESMLSWKARRAGIPFRMSVHSRLVIRTTWILILSGWCLFLLFEWNVSFAGMAWVDRVSNALFMSVTARTAGFNSIDYFGATNSSDFLTIILMSIGGSPGSAAGGLKITTIALIGLLALAKIRGQKRTGFAHRTIPEASIQQAIGLFVIFFVVATGSIFVLTATEAPFAHPTDNAQFLPLFFESVSALNTVGLSMGMTPELSQVGRIVSILLMFIGRVGPLTVAAALAARAARSNDGSTWHDAYEDVAIG